MTQRMKIRVRPLTGEQLTGRLREPGRTTFVTATGSKLTGVVPPMTGPDLNTRPDREDPQRGRRGWREAVYRDNLARQLGGWTEVPVPGGSIDVVTRALVIEVKAARKWRDGLAQAVRYGAALPQMIPLLALFGRCPSYSGPGVFDLTMARLVQTCHQQGVGVVWYQPRARRWVLADDNLLDALESHERAQQAARIAEWEAAHPDWAQERAARLELQAERAERRATWSLQPRVWVPCLPLNDACTACTAGIGVPCEHRTCP